MALLHHAELTPPKIELVQDWVKSQPWFQGAADAELTGVAAFRFDDPAGQVGVETLLMRAGDGPVMQVPLTYRDAPLAGADERLIGTLQHSVLGTRWVYDALGDPVYLLTVASTIVTGGREAEMYFEVDGAREPRESTAEVAGSGMNAVPAPSLPSVGDVAVRSEGGVTVAETASWTIVVARVPVAGPQHPESIDGSRTMGALAGTWPGQAEPHTFVSAFPR